MSSDRLERINDAMQRHVAAGTIQGAVTAVARRGKLVHFEAHLCECACSGTFHHDELHQTGARCSCHDVGRGRLLG